MTVGNRTQLIRANAAASLLPTALTQTECDAANEQIRFNSATPNLVYDSNGNLTSFTDGTGTTTYTWNARNQLAAISGPGLSASFAYDGLGRRKSKTVNSATTGYWYDGNDVLAELSGSTPTATYIRSLSIDEPFIRKGASDEYYQTDALGSALALTDSAGASQTAYTYEPFGKTTITGTSSNPFQYTGRENDGAGLYYYRARYLSPQQERFLREDPILIPFFPPDIGLCRQGHSLVWTLPDKMRNPRQVSPQLFNAYIYGNNNPLRFRDPTGLTPRDPDPDPYPCSKEFQDCLNSIPSNDRDTRNCFQSTDNTIRERCKSTNYNQRCMSKEYLDYRYNGNNCKGVPPTYQTPECSGPYFTCVYR